MSFEGDSVLLLFPPLLSNIFSFDVSEVAFSHSSCVKQVSRSVCVRTARLRLVRVYRRAPEKQGGSRRIDLLLLRVTDSTKARLNDVHLSLAFLTYHGTVLLLQ